MHGHRGRVTYWLRKKIASEIEEEKEEEKEIEEKVVLE